MDSGTDNSLASATRWELFAATMDISPLAKRLAMVSAFGTAAIAVGVLAGMLVTPARAGADACEAPTWAQIIDAPTWAHRTLPPTLRETGLYADWKSARVSPDAKSFSPQYPLWSDGATKRRWIYLPGPIDTTDPDNWQFPVGTRIWKEFSFGARVETRFMIRARDGWQMATYAWTPDGAHAIRASLAGAESVPLAQGGSTHGAGTNGSTNGAGTSGSTNGAGTNGSSTNSVATDGAGTNSVATHGAGVATHGARASHRIPSQADCVACHDNGKSPVLGFSALQLSPDRDPNAVHREPAGEIDLAWLAERGFVRDVPSPRIAGSATQRAALGYLHGNCSGCHRAEGPLAGLGMTLAHDGTVRTTVGVPSKYRAPALRVAPGDPANSVLLARMKARHDAAQMPPIGTVLVDEEAIRLVASWIDQLAPTTTRGDRK